MQGKNRRRGIAAMIAALAVSICHEPAWAEPPVACDYATVSYDVIQLPFQSDQQSTKEYFSAFWFYVAEVVYEAGGGVRFTNPMPLSSDTSYWSEAKGWSGDSSKIVFASTRGEEDDRRALNSDAYVMDVVSSEVTRLTHAPTWEEAADVLRGDLGYGDAVTFISDRDTPQPEQAGYGVSDRIPNDMDWALVASAAVPLATWTSHEIFVAGPEGDRGWVRRLTFDYDKDGTNSRAPKWSPDGTMIAFRQSAGSPEARVEERAGEREERMMLITFACP